MDLVNAIKSWFQRKPKKNAHQVNGDKAQELKNLLHMLQLTEEIEVSCDEVYRALDQYVELANAGEDVQDLMPLIKRHLEICKDCNEEYLALLQVLNSVPS